MMGQTEEHTVSIVVPVYNEADHIERSLKEMVERLEELAIKFELIVVESGSTDRSAEIIAEICKNDHRIRLVRQGGRQGMGSAIACGFNQAKADLLFWIDSDMPYDLKFLKRGMDIIADADVVAGYRSRREEPFKRKLYSKVFNVLANVLFGIRLRDINFAFKLFRRKVFDRIDITSKSSFFAAEVLTKCRRRGLKIEQFPVDYDPRKSGKSKLGNIRTVLFLLKEMIRFRLLGRA